MTEDVLTNGGNTSNAASSVQFTDADREAAIRRYMQIQREIAQLELEKDQLRGLLVQQLEGVVPARWHIAIDEKPLLVVHEYKTSVRYDEKILSERLGERYSEILEIDGTKIRKNRDLVRPLLAPVLAKIGTPSASRVKVAVQAGSLTADDFRGAFKKTLTPYISIRVENARSAPAAIDAPY